MDKANQIQIGMLGAIIVLLLVQMSGILGTNASNNSVRANARENITAKTTTPTPPAATNSLTPNNPATPITPPAPTGPTTTMTFKETAHDFGTIVDGENVEHIFEFTNTGSEPLTITNAKGSCGCTVPEWPKEPIPPGQTSSMKVAFNSKGKSGKRDQKVTITANTNPPQTIISMKGEVIKDPNSNTATTIPGQ
ncbi:MAG: DUF1573 domain-containing protein [Bacteroidota bacterium]